VIGLKNFGAGSGIEEISGNGYANVTIAGWWEGSSFDFSGTTLVGLAEIQGGGWLDTITGSQGNDTIRGLAANDVLNGGAGSDTYLVGGTNDGWDSYADTGASGTDRILATQAGTVIGLKNFGAGSGIEEISGNGYANVVLSGHWEGGVLDFSGTTLTGIAEIQGNGWIDVITGNSGNDTIRGLAANDVLKGGGGNDLLDGGDGTDTAVFSGNFADYSFAQNADGSWQATGIAGAGLADGSDKLVAIETLQFADKTMTLSASGPVAGGSTGGGSTGGGSTGGSTGGGTPVSTAVIHAPDVPVATGAQDIVGFVLENTASTAQAAGIVTFGQVFVAGDVMPGAKLVALINGVETAVQMDVKALNDDGSVRHAILTLNAPAIAAGGSVEMMLKETASAPASTALTAQDAIAKGLNVSLEVNLHNADGSTSLKTFSAASLLQNAIAQNKVETWMSGSQASEFRVEATVTTGLKAIFDIRVMADGNVHTDVILANDSTFTAGINSFTYDVAIKQGASVVYSEANMFHHANSTWHQEAWLKGEPAINVQRDVDYLIKSGAVPALDTALGVSEAAIQADHNAIAAADTDPLGAALVNQYMPQTGGRADIGATPEWYARYLVTQDARAYEVMLANADAAGAVPWHYTDEATGNAVRVDQHPGLWIDYRGLGAGSIPDLGTAADYAGWSPDTAHNPALSYLPYLFTGSHYYLDEMQAQAAWTVATRDPVYTLGDGVLLPSSEQLRAMAWTIRDLMDAAYLTPEGDPMKAYFEGLVEQNLASLVDIYVTSGRNDAAGELEGWISSYTTDSSGIGMPPWQQDYFAVVLGEAAARGYGDAVTLMQWMENFSAGRFINAENGFNPAHGTGYYYAVKDSAGNLIDTWAEFYQAAGFDPATAGDTSLVIDGYANESGGYAANARAAMASFVSVTGSADAVEAYGYVISQTQNIAMGSFQYSPLWNMTPRLADGTYLNADDILVDTGAGSNRTGTAQNELIYGGSGNNTIAGGGGIDLLFGGQGNDVVSGDAGNDYVFGNDGNDTLAGGQGNDILAGGQGADRFVYQAGGGKDEITDFTAAQGDTVQLQGTGISSFAQLQSYLAQDSQGVWINLDQNNAIHLQGTTIAQLAASNFIFS
jgi:Ca2+-binding RTX toxin-like protein